MVDLEQVDAGWARSWQRKIYSNCSVVNKTPIRVEIVHYRR